MRQVYEMIKNDVHSEWKEIFPGNPKINTFDYDGVINMGPNHTGVRPCVNDIIVSGKPISEYEELRRKIKRMDISNHVIMNPLARTDKKYSRRESGRWKAKVLLLLQECYDIGIHFEDDPVQIEEIRLVIPNLTIVHLDHKLVDHELVKK
jgi:hypothetical protein